MFNLGPMEMVVLAIVGIVVIGPEKLPGLARDAAGMLRTLRELATGARQQLRDELGPEFADMDLRNLNPRTAVTRMVLGEDHQPGRFDPKAMVRDAVFGDEDLRAADPRSALRDARDGLRSSYSFEAGSDDAEAPRANGHTTGRVDVTKGGAESPSPRPRPRPRPSSSYGDDIT